MINANPLQIAEIMEIVVRSKVFTRTAKIGALTFMARNTMPALRPLFSTLVELPKKVNNEGMPIPNEKPENKLIIEARVTSTLLNRTSNNELTIPKSTQK